ncbi:MAG: DUF481 domain-containing protein [Verrucomicrobiota bacterium]
MTHHFRSIVGALAASALLLGSGMSGQADTVTTSDGSILNGRIAGIANGTLELESKFAGSLEISLEHITRLQTDQAYAIDLVDGNRLVGELEHNDEGSLTVRSALGAISISVDSIVAMNAKGSAPAPPPQTAPSEDSPPAPPEWSYEGTVDIGGKTGNSERLSTAASVAATRTHGGETLRLHAAAEKVEDDGNTSSDERSGGIDFERVIGNNHSWYTRIEMARDDVEQIDLRTTAALGYGYYLIRRDDHKLRLRAGSLFRHESYSNAEDEQTAGIDLGMRDDWQLTDALRMINEVNYTPSIEDTADYRILQSSSLETPLQLTNGNLRLRLGITNEYDSQPAPGLEKLDTLYFTRLVFGW